VSRPNRGELWIAELSPTRGREQHGTRPVLIVSDDLLNHGPSQLTIVIPLTTRDRGIATHVRIAPPEGQVREVSFAMCEMVRSIDRSRLRSAWGAISSRTLDQVDERLRALLVI